MPLSSVAKAKVVKLNHVYIWKREAQSNLLYLYKNIFDRVINQLFNDLYGPQTKLLPLVL